MGIFSGLAGAGAHIVRFGANLQVGVTGARRLGALGGMISKLQKNFISLGVTTIFLDRLVQSLSRAWGLLNGVLGVMRIAQTSESVLRLSTASGVATDRLQAFTSMAGKVGVEIADVSDLFQTLTERVDDLRSGTEQGISDDFMRFGMSASTFQGANNGLDQFMVLIRELETLDPAKRMAALEKLLGGDLARKFGQLGNTAEIIAGMQEAIATGQVLSEQQLKNAQKFAMAQRRAGNLLRAVSNNIAAALIPVLTLMADTFSGFAASVATFLNSRAGQFADHLVKSMQPFLDALQAVKDFIDTDIKDSGEFFSRLMQGALIAVVGIAAIVGGQLIGMFLALSTIVTAVSFVFDDIATYLRGGNSLFGEMLSKSALFQVFVNGVLFAISALQDLAISLGNNLSQLATGPFGILVKMIITVLPYALGAVFKVFQLIFNVVTGIANVMAEFVFLAARASAGLNKIMRGDLGGFGDLSQVVFGGAGGPGSSGPTIGGLASLANAFTGAGPTATEMLIDPSDTGQTSIFQTNNISATTSNPAAFTGSALGQVGNIVHNTVSN